MCTTRLILCVHAYLESRWIVVITYCTLWCFCILSMEMHGIFLSSSLLSLLRRCLSPVCMRWIIM